MAKEPFEQFAIPNEVRAFAEQSVSQARKAFDGFIEAAKQAMGQFQGQAQAARSGASEIAHKSMAYAETECGGDFRFRAKADAREGYAPRSWPCNPNISASQMQTISTQAQDLGQSAAKMVVGRCEAKT